MVLRQLTCIDEKFRVAVEEQVEAPEDPEQLLVRDITMLVAGYILPTLKLILQYSTVVTIGPVLKDIGSCLKCCVERVKKSGKRLRRAARVLDWVERIMRCSAVRHTLEMKLTNMS